MEIGRVCVYVYACLYVHGGEDLENFGRHLSCQIIWMMSCRQYFLFGFQLLDFLGLTLSISFVNCMMKYCNNV